MAKANGHEWLTKVNTQILRPVLLEQFLDTWIKLQFKVTTRPPSSLVNYKLLLTPVF